MGWLLGFGIPIGYIVTGFLLSRAVFRSRHKRGHNSYTDQEDTAIVCGLMVVCWPILAPIYFTTVTVMRLFKTRTLPELFSKFYEHHLPVTHETKRLDALRAKHAQKQEISRLEKELGIADDEH